MCEFDVIFGYTEIIEANNENVTVKVSEYWCGETEDRYIIIPIKAFIE